MDLCTQSKRQRKRNRERMRGFEGEREGFFAKRGIRKRKITYEIFQFGFPSKRESCQ